MLIREFLQGCDPIFRQRQAPSRAAGWVLLPDVDEDAAPTTLQPASELP